METAYMVWSFSLPTRSAAGSRVDDDRRCRSPQLGFTTSQPRGCIPSSAPQTALREAVEQPPGRCRGQPFGRTFETRTVTRTALREDLRNSDGHTDSPSGGTHELRPKLRSLYRVAHIRCHLSGRASPSRTSSHRNPDSLSALRNYFAGREREARSCMALVCEKGWSFRQPPPPLFIGQAQGWLLQEAKGGNTKKALKVASPRSQAKSTFTIHDDIFQRPFELKIFMWAQNISSTH